MDQQHNFPFQNFEQSATESEYRVSKFSTTTGVTPGNMLISSVSNIQGGASVISPGSLTNSSTYPLHIHLAGNSGNLPPSLNLPVQIPSSAVNLAVPMQFPNVSSGVPIQLSGTTMSMPVQNSVPASTIPINLQPSTTINVPLHIQNNNNLQITSQTLNVPMQLHNSNNQSALHGSIIHLHMGQNQTRKPTQSIGNDIVNESRTSMSQIQQQDVRNKHVDLVTHLNNTGTIQVDSSVQTVPHSSAVITTTGSSSHSLQMRASSRTVPQFVYIQTPTGLKPVSGTEVVNNASANNPPQIIVRRPVTSSANIQFISTQSKNNTSKSVLTTKTSTAVTTHNQSIVIQKPKHTSTNVIPVSATGRSSYTYVPVVSNKIPIGKPQENSSSGHIPPESANSTNQKVFIAPLNVPKIPSTKFILPMTLPTAMSSKGPIINLQISNGQLQNDPLGNITIMRDSILNSTSVDNTSSQIDKLSVCPDVEKDISTFSVSAHSDINPQNEHVYPVSIPGSRVEPTGEREYSLSIPESNSTLNDDMYTVSISAENGNEEYIENISLISEKEKSTAHSAISNNYFRKVSASVPAPAILRRSNSEYVEKKIHVSSNKRRISLCTDTEREKLYKLKDKNIENNSKCLKISAFLSNDDNRIPSLFCDEQFDKDLDCRLPLKESTYIDGIKQGIPQDEEIMSIASRLSTQITLIPKGNAASEDQIKNDKQYLTHKKYQMCNKNNIFLDENKSDFDNDNTKHIFDKLNHTDCSSKDGQSNDEPFCLNWSDGIGKLKGSKLKFEMNEFGILDLTEQTNLELECFANIFSVKQKAPLTVRPEPFTNNRKLSSPEDLYCCDNCGTHGAAAEFVTPNFCSLSCQTSYYKNNKSRQMKIRDLAALKKLQKKKKLILMKSDSAEYGNNSEAKTGDEVDKFDFGEIVTSVPECDKTKLLESQPKNVDGVLINQKYPWMCGESGFSWTRYLEHSKAKQAPDKLFKNPFPYAKNPFRIDMKLEAIDPCRPAIFAVVSVHDIQGYRLRLHFDGYDDNYDFWVNADSSDIFPAGWCEKHNRMLQPPLGYNQNNFSWQQYNKQAKGVPAPRQLFHHVSSSNVCPNGFRIGMKLEADDRKNNLVCVATVTDIMDNRILVRFDSWDDIYDYWVEPSSPYIHPVGWCDENGFSLTPPNSCKDPDNFTWESYLSETMSVAVPARAFKTRAAHSFKCNMKLEVVDKRVPFLIRVATITDVRSYQLKISFDGWPDELSYWVDDDSPDIHPVGWCLKTGHPLEPPLTEEEKEIVGICGTTGCKGLGSTKGPSFTRHSTNATCPYHLPNNSSSVSPTLPDRLAASRPPPERTVPRPREPKRGRPPKVSLPPVEPLKEKVPLPRGRPPKHRKLEITVKSESQASDDESNSGSNQVKQWQHSEVEKYSVLSVGTDSLVQNIEDNIEPHELIIRQGRIAPVAWSLPGSQTRPSLSLLLTGSSLLSSDPRSWDQTDVSEFISHVCQRSDLSWYFSKHLVDGEALIMISQEELIDVLGLKLGPAMKIYDSIVQLRERIYC